MGADDQTNHPILAVGADGSDYMAIRLKRVYEQPTPSDGFRVLVERLWPRGVSKQKARIDLWAGRSGSRLILIGAHSVNLNLGLN